MDADVVGDKGAALARILRNDLSVPNGFVLTTAVPWGIDRTSLPDDVWKEVCDAVNRLARSTGRAFPATFDTQGQLANGGALSMPLLLSVRQSPVGGHPDAKTILNIGMNSEVMNRMRSASGRPLYVLDTYRRFLLDWGTKVKGIPAAQYKAVVDEALFRLNARSIHSVSCIASKLLTLL